MAALMHLFGAWTRRRVPYVPQMELAECGAACLSMILRYYRHHISLFEARQECSVSRDGASAYSLAKAAERRGLRVEALKIQQASDLADAPLPAILHLRERHFVVLDSVRGGRARVIDPASGRSTLPLRELYEACSGVLLTFHAEERSPRRPRPRSGVAVFMSTIFSYSPTTILIIASTLAVEFLGLAFPAASQLLIDFVIRPKQESWLWILCGLLTFTAVLRILLYTLRDATVHVLNQLLDLRFISGFVNRLLHLPISFFQHRTTGDLMDRVAATLEFRGLSSRIITSFLDAAVVLAYIGLMIAYSWRLGTIVFISSVLRLATVHFLQRKGKEAAAIEQSKRGRESGLLIATFTAPEQSKLSGVRQHLLERYTERLFQRLNATLARRRLTEGVAQLTIVVDGMTHALLLWTGGTQLLAEKISIGIFAAFLTMDALLGRPLESILATLTQLPRLGSVLARADDILQTPPETSGTVDPRSLAARIAADRLSFRYSDQSSDILHDLSFEIKEGEKVAIVGPSGAGKSTLARLMMGLLRPTEGRVLIGGVDLQRIDLDQLRSQIGVVLQETFIFNDTARANIALKDPTLSLDDVKTAAKLACIDTFIESLQLGYETMLGQHGHRLSGGQRQRISLARALAAKPRILFLDEATSSLDSVTERQLLENLSPLPCTRVVVAHRLVTTRDADRIFVLEKGRIVQEGTYDELAARPGLFRQMLQGREAA